MVSHPSSKPTSPSVLIVEDDLVTNKALERILGNAGLRTITAGSASAAWRAIECQSPDLLLLDVNLPDGNGYEICEKLQAEPRYSQIPVLFISANSDLKDKLRGFEAGGVDYIPKPLASAEVLARVGTHLRLKRASDALLELQMQRIEKLAAAQASSLPQPADFPEARFSVCFKQRLSAGGDFYDVIPSGENSTDYMVADASGHDLGASYWTAALKALLTEYANPLNSPAEVLRALNTALMRILPTGSFFTVVHARLNRRANLLSLASAGHPPAIITRAGNRQPEVIQLEGDVLGAFPDSVFGSAEMHFRPGDRLFIYTDGLVECDGPSPAGITRLAGLCSAGADVPMPDLVQSLVSETCQGRVTDDVMLMGVES